MGNLEGYIGRDVSVGASAFFIGFAVLVNLVKWRWPVIAHACFGLSGLWMTYYSPLPTALQGDLFCVVRMV